MREIEALLDDRVTEGTREVLVSKVSVGLLVLGGLRAQGDHQDQRVRLAILATRAQKDKTAKREHPVRLESLHLAHRDRMGRQDRRGQWATVEFKDLVESRAPLVWRARKVLQDFQVLLDPRARMQNRPKGRHAKE
jgi:hypothetical protein